MSSNFSSCMYLFKVFRECKFLIATKDTVAESNPFISGRNFETSAEREELSSERSTLRSEPPHGNTDDFEEKTESNKIEWWEFRIANSNLYLEEVINIVKLV